MENTKQICNSSTGNTSCRLLETLWSCSVTALILTDVNSKFFWLGKLVMYSIRRWFSWQATWIGGARVLIAATIVWNRDTRVTWLTASALWIITLKYANPLGAVDAGEGLQRISAITWVESWNLEILDFRLFSSPLFGCNGSVHSSRYRPRRSARSCRTVQN